MGTPHRRYTQQMLDEAVAHSFSVNDVLRYLGIPLAGGTHQLVSKRIREYGIDTSHFVRYQGAKHLPNKLSSDEILVVLQPGSPRRKVHLLIRALVDVGRPHVCAGCGIRPLWCGQPLTLHVDHINGDWLDNRGQNLRFMCPNCHSQTPNHSGKGAGRNRSSR